MDSKEAMELLMEIVESGRAVGESQQRAAPEPPGSTALYLRVLVLQTFFDMAYVWKAAAVGRRRARTRTHV
jgi:hypothetical protein